MMNPKNIVPFCALLLLIICLQCTGCRKSVNVTKARNTYTFNFYFDSAFAEAQDVFFYATDSSSSLMPPNAVIRWNFGDGTPVTETNIHTYTRPGTYMATMLVNQEESAPVAVHILPYATSPHTAAMAGSRLWEVLRWGSVSSNPDTGTYTITVLNEGLVQFNGSSYYCMSVDSGANKVMTFGSNPANGTLRYFYEKDSLEYDYYASSGHAEFHLLMHTF